jgi:hypothetical protein
LPDTSAPCASEYSFSADQPVVSSLTSGNQLQAITHETINSAIAIPRIFDIIALPFLGFGL